ncbi:hypothetical protein V6N12_054303 [Hibiscus sabdariffa]|uniref:RNase H type-1 domain-containing protein n=1 Tax=Hibiscus sabdariffa TaxID=183260 RepID=A0ABR2D007_9ROSI
MSMNFQEWLWKQRCSLIFNDCYVEREDFVEHCFRLTAEFVECQDAHTPRVISVVANSENLRSRSWDVRFQSVSRLANSVADSLARLGQGAPFEVWIFQDPPPEVAAAVQKDLLV